VMQAKVVLLSAALGLAKRRAARSQQVQPQMLSRIASLEAWRGRHSADPRGRIIQQPQPARLTRSQSLTRKKPDQAAAGPVKPPALLFRNHCSQPTDLECREVGPPVSSSTP
jgi:hypothetical protein